MKWKGRRQSKNVRFATKEEQDAGKKGLADKLAAERAMNQSMTEIKAQNSPYLRQKDLKRPKVHDSDRINNIINNVNDTRSKKLIGYQDSYKPQKMQVTPGAWKTSRLKKS